MKKQKDFKKASDLSIKDVVYEIEGASMLEHLKLDGESVSLNSIQYYSLNKEVITALALSENEDEIIVNGKLPLPLKGSLKTKVTDILTDQKEAIALTIAELMKEKKKTLALIALSEKCLDGLKSNMKIYEEQAKDLGLHIRVEDRSGEVLFDVAEEPPSED